MKLTRRVLFTLCAATGVALAAGTAAAQAYPTKPITIVVAYPPGGDSDAFARLYADKLTSRLGQTVVVDNRAGASGTLGAGIVARAPADGYMLLFAPSTFAVAHHVLKAKVPYDVTKDFTSVIMTGSTPLLLATGAASGVKDLRSLVADVKGGKELQYASPGSGSPMHIIAEMFNHAAGVKIQHVPYRGTAPAVNDAIAGHVPLVYTTPGAVTQYMATGRLIPLATTERERSPILPDVPTLVELGYKDVEITAWFGIFGPRGMPAEVTALLNRHMNEILAMPDVKERMRGMGVLTMGGEPSRLSQIVERDHVRFGKVVKDFGISAD